MDDMILYNVLSVSEATQRVTDNVQSVSTGATPPPKQRVKNKL